MNIAWLAVSIYVPLMLVAAWKLWPLIAILK